RALERARDDDLWHPQHRDGAAASRPRVPLRSPLRARGAHRRGALDQPRLRLRGRLGLPRPALRAPRRARARHGRAMMAPNFGSPPGRGLVGRTGGPMRNGKRLGLFAITALLASGCEGRASTILDTLAPAPIDPASPPL